MERTCQFLSSSMCQWISCTKWNSNDSRLEYTKNNRSHGHFLHLIQTNRKGKTATALPFFWANAYREIIINESEQIGEAEP